MATYGGLLVTMGDLGVNRKFRRVSRNPNPTTNLGGKTRGFDFYMRSAFFVSIASTAAALAIGTTTALAATVTVQPGQSLWSIAKTNNVSLPALEAANPTVQATNLQVGTQLELPSVQRYVVQQGDTFFSIAQQFHVTVAALESANPGVQANNLLVQSTLTIPATANILTAAPAARVATAAPVSTSTTTASATGTTQQQNLYWMEHVISAEANAEPLSAQIAVGDVILHRMHAGGYGSTVKDVVFQIINGHYQFTSVANGYIYSTPYATSITAAEDVLNSGEDVVPGALVFYNPSQTPASSWVRSQPTITQLGNLVFAK